MLRPVRLKVTTRSSPHSRMPSTFRRMNSSSRFPSARGVSRRSVSTCAWIALRMLQLRIRKPASGSPKPDKVSLPHPVGRRSTSLHCCWRNGKASDDCLCRLVCSVATCSRSVECVAAVASRSRRFECADFNGEPAYAGSSAYSRQTNRQ